jgi:hypothetical protein
MPHARGMPEGSAVAAGLAFENCHRFMARPFMNSANGVRRSWLPEPGSAGRGVSRPATCKINWSALTPSRRRLSRSRSAAGVAAGSR